MSNTPTGVASEVLIGPARLLIAPIGTTVPTLDGSVIPITWDAAWKEVGYTEDGTMLSYSPTVKDIMVDEEMAPIKKILDAEKATISCKAAQSTLKNLNAAISASIYTHAAATVTDAETSTLDIGSGDLTEMMVGLEGLSPTGRQRIIVAYRGMAQANVQMSFKRGDKTITPIEFGLLADSSQTKGKRLFKIVDIGVLHT